jgi:hypothetical protein
MFKRVVNEVEFLELCNQELRRHPDFEEGMEITHVPWGASGSGLNGYEWKGPDSILEMIPGVVNKVKEQYDFHVTPRKSKGKNPPI